jgi:LPXTG-motif cell wall-anchored protein
VTKGWKNKDGQVLDGTTGKEIPAGAKVTFTLYVGENPVTVTKEEGGQPVTSNRAVELSGTDATSAGTVTPEADDYEANWVAYFTHLPKYDADGKIIEYTVRETGTWTGYVVDGENTASNDGKITNKEKALTLDILKVEKDKETPLEKAVFNLYKIDENSVTLDKDPATEQVATTKALGKASFSNLSIGYYIVTETKAPEGYILTGEDSFYIEVTETGINLLTKSEGAPITWAKDATSYGNVKTFTAATADTNAQAKVENTPGARLPSTGGSGTIVFTTLGSILIAGAGMLLWRRRRLI